MSAFACGRYRSGAEYGGLERSELNKMNKQVSVAGSLCHCNPFKLSERVIGLACTLSKLVTV